MELNRHRRTASRPNCALRRKRGHKPPHAVPHECTWLPNIRTVRGHAWTTRRHSNQRRDKGADGTTGRRATWTAHGDYLSVLASTVPRASHGTAGRA
eukprot:23805-Prymnesium_polylepis.1